jgi:CRISPR system Cascade subunit CasC
MATLELHILQSFPVSCLNRDDVGAPKSVKFGGYNRGRVSSQCWKRVIRELARKTSPRFFNGLRSRLVIDPLAKALEENGIAAEVASELAKAVVESLAKLDEKAIAGGTMQSKACLYLSPMEIAECGKIIAEAYAANVEKDKDKEQKVLKKAMSQAAKKVDLKDAADIAIFGRMVADDPSVNIEAAGSFTHAISVHKVENDLDFFTAVDDLQKKDESGVAMMGHLEFNAACYYRYAAYDLNKLFRDHLSLLTVDDRKQVVSTVIRATLLAVPSARRHSMCADTRPGFVRAVIREDGNPMVLSNAFLNPIKPEHDKSILESARDAMVKHFEEEERTWCFNNKHVDLPECNLDDFCTEILKHVQ